MSPPSLFTSLVVALQREGGWLAFINEGKRRVLLNQDSVNREIIEV